MCGTQSVDIWRLCGRLCLWCLSEFPEATSLLVLFGSSVKFTCSWSSSLATSLLVLSSRTASFCHAWELDAGSWVNSFFFLDMSICAAPSLPVLVQLFLTGCLEYPQTFRRSRNLQRQWRPRSSSAMTLPQLFLLPSVPASSSPSFPHSWSSWCSESSKLSWNGWCYTNNKDCSTHHVWSHLKSPFVKMSAIWCLVVSTYLIWILGSRLILSHNRSRATLWILDTCLIVGLLPLMIILITASLYSNVEHRTELRRLRVRRIIINITQFKIVVMNRKIWCVLVWWCVTRRVSSFLIIAFLWLVWRIMKHFNNQSPKIKTWYSIHA